MVSGVAVASVLNVLPAAQATFVSDPQLPENSCMRPLVPKLPPVDVNAILGYTDVAWKVYQTSGVSVPQVVAMEGAVSVALFSVPFTTAGTNAEVRVIAFAQRSFTGASRTEMPKFQPAPAGAVLLL